MLEKYLTKLSNFLWGADEVTSEIESNYAEYRLGLLLDGSLK